MNRGAAAIAALAAAAFMTGALAQDAPETTKRCESARKKIEREQKSVDAAADSIARDRHARDACTSRSLCTRYDASITATERRKGRLEARLNRYQDEAQKACAPG